MSLKQISLNHFRNLQATTIDFHPNFNLIFGENATGKTSLLEAIHTGCQGQSFRTRSLDHCIQHGKQDFLIFNRFDEYKSGLNKNKEKTQIRIDGVSIHRLSELATRNAVRIINHQSFDLTTGHPGHRRDYLDWCMFHVEHQFIAVRKQYYHALKQRNALLRHKKGVEQIEYWNQYLVDSAEQIRYWRIELVNQISQIINQSLFTLLEGLDIGIHYQQGWDQQLGYGKLLQEKLAGDLRQGFTRYGIHRDDMEIVSGKQSVQNVLSRGQLKRLSIVLVLAQLVLARQNSNKPVLVLIDDIASELDIESIDLVISLLERLHIQVFITSINPLQIKTLQDKEFKMFHVEHGIIKGC